MRHRARHKIAALLSCVMITNVAYTMLIPFVPTLREQYEMSAFEIGMAFGGFALAKAFSQPLGGALVDRVGAYRIAVAGLLLTAVATGGLSFSESGGFIILWRLLWGAAEGFTMPSLYRLANMFAEGARIDAGKVLGWFGSAAVSGMAAGPAIGFFHEYVGFQTAFQLGALATLLSSVLLAFTLHSASTTRTEKDEAEPVTEKPVEATGSALRLLILFVVVFGSIDFVNNALYSSLEPVLPLYAESRFENGITLTSVLFFLGLFLFVVMSSLTGSLVSRVDPMLLVTSSFAVAGSGLFIIGTTENAVLVIFGFLLFMVSQPVVYVSARKGIALLPGESQGKAYGYFGFVSDFGWVAGPAAGSWLFMVLEPGVFTVLAGIALTAGVVSLVLSYLKLPKSDLGTIHVKQRDAQEGDRKLLDDIGIK